MARKKPPLSLRRPGDVVDPFQAERFVRMEASPDVQEPGRLDVKTSRRLDVEAPRRPDAQTLERPEVAALGAPIRTDPPTLVSKALVYRKRTDDHRRRMTVYLPEDLSRRLRLYAAEKDQDYSVVLAEALGALLDRQGFR